MKRGGPVRTVRGNFAVPRISPLADVGLPSTSKPRAEARRRRRPAMPEPFGPGPNAPARVMAAPSGAGSAGPSGRNGTLSSPLRSIRPRRGTDPGDRAPAGR